MVDVTIGGRQQRLETGSMDPGGKVKPVGVAAGMSQNRCQSPVVAVLAQTLRVGRQVAVDQILRSVARVGAQQTHEAEWKDLMTLGRR